jgi:3-(3-hydroxy-phenyl)propionate hydroxylase
LSAVPTPRPPRSFAYRRSPDQDGQGRHHPVIVVGAGPVGLTIAIDLARRGRPVVLLDEDDRVSEGSRAICFAKRTLEIWDRLGCVEPIVARGVTWNTGKVFFRDRQLYGFDLQPEPDHRFPAFVNLQQYEVEAILAARAAEMPGIDLRWRSRVVDVEPAIDGGRLQVETPDGRYALEYDWLIAADGARSTIRRLLGLEFRGQVFEDHFLIADVRMDADFPTERWFWFDPPFHPGQSALLHRQADNVWRIDLQLGWDVNPDIERLHERVVPRLKAMLGPDRPFTIVWDSVYTFQCRRLDRFRHGRVVFIGDAAHQLSPFGARGANSGVQDADNLGWKLDLVLAGKAPDRLIDSYDAERTLAADINIMNSTRSTDFITPKSPISRLFRDATLDLAQRLPFARALVNSGRLSVATEHADSPLSTPDDGGFAGGVPPGAPVADAPLRAGDAESWLTGALPHGFALMWFDDGGPRPVCEDGAVPLSVIPVGAAGWHDTRGRIAQRYDAGPGTCYLIRPDGHVAARWRRFDHTAVRAALARAIGEDAR